jgi:hypothetical protein
MSHTITSWHVRTGRAYELQSWGKGVHVWLPLPLPQPESCGFIWRMCANMHRPGLLCAPHPLTLCTRNIVYELDLFIYIWILLLCKTWTLHMDYQARIKVYFLQTLNTIDLYNYDAIDFYMLFESTYNMQWKNF